MNSRHLMCPPQARRRAYHIERKLLSKGLAVDGKTLRCRCPLLALS
jgi:hypothetical protein